MIGVIITTASVLTTNKTIVAMQEQRLYTKLYVSFPSTSNALRFSPSIDFK